MELRLSKYDPKFRDKDGYYLKDEWTSYWDIGKKFDGNLFSLKQYQEVEQKYIKAIRDVLIACEITEVIVTECEKSYFDELHRDNLYTDFAKLKKGNFYNIDSIEAILKLCLREYAWTQLESDNKKCEVIFGYDYYVSFRIIDSDMENIKKIILSNGLYLG